MILASVVNGSSITTEVTVLSSSVAMELTLESFTSASLPAFQIRTEEAQLRGPPGPPPGPPPDIADIISTDPNNRLKAGSDGKILGEEVTTDLLALYILARS